MERTNLNKVLAPGGAEGIKPDSAGENVPETLDRDTGRVESNQGMEINTIHLGSGHRVASSVL